MNFILKYQVGVFAFGCAAGNCFDGSCKTEVIHHKKTTVQEIEIEEVKHKKHGNIFRTH
jgi:hypothetical protein